VVLVGVKGGSGFLRAMGPEGVKDKDLYILIMQLRQHGAHEEGTFSGVWHPNYPWLD
jgi:hypothetical protein